ncbi:hypothetical protein RUM44_004692 [Polyplax serrata]|uniref:Uncharacterized protein n=1 Tax=Polyplax serrata TaxID=468196 RepID=A0ABR1B3J5_POLSC
MNRVTGAEVIRFDGFEVCEFPAADRRHRSSAFEKPDTFLDDTNKLFVKCGGGVSIIPSDECQKPFQRPLISRCRTLGIGRGKTRPNCSDSVFNDAGRDEGRQGA